MYPTSTPTPTTEAAAAPWETAAAHATDAHTGDDPLPYDGPGAVTHSHPIVTFGSAGEPVRHLARLLAELGYRDNTITRGLNAAGVLDDSVMTCVRAFCADTGARNDLAEYRGQSVPAEDLVRNHVGPHIWQALEDAAARARAEQGAPAAA